MVRSREHTCGGNTDNGGDVMPLDIQVQRMFKFETDRPLKAFVDITVNDAILIKGVRILENSKTRTLFVSMPREQARDEKWYDTIRCLTPEVRDNISSVVLAAYREDELYDAVDTVRPPDKPITHVCKKCGRKHKEGSHGNMEHE